MAVLISWNCNAFDDVTVLNWLVIVTVAPTNVTAPTMTSRNGTDRFLTDVLLPRGAFTNTASG